MKSLQFFGLGSLSLVLTLSFTAQANLKSHKLSTELELSAPRWMYDSSQSVKKEPVTQALVKMKSHARDKKWAECLAQYSRVLKLAPSLKPWITRQNIQCAMGLAKLTTKWPELEQATRVVSQNPEWLLSESYSEPLQTVWLDGMSQLLSLQVKSSRKSAWRTFEVLQAHQDRLSKEQVSSLFQMGGELAFVEQNLSKALGFFERSYEAKASKEVSDRLTAIRSKLLGQKSEGETTPSEVGKDTSLILGEEENEIYQRMQKALASKDYVAAVEDGIKLIVKFPGGAASDKAEDQILRIYLTVGGEKRKEFRLINQRIVKQMKEADADRILRWASNAYWRTYYDDALELSEVAAEKFQGQQEAAKAYYYAAKSAYYIGEEATAEKHFKVLVEKFAGTEQAEESLFLLGLQALRKEKYGDAAAHLERLLAISKNEKWSYRGLYWYWRALQRTNTERGLEAALKLEREFPLTYYGLRARAELNGNRLTWTEESKPITEEFWFSSQENEAWARLQVLLKAGWFEEAQFELSSLPSPYTPEAQMVMAYIWSRALNHHQAILLANQAWKQKPELRSKNLISIVFPSEFESLVKKQVSATKLNHHLVLALIRQESSFRPEALSHSGARGLMQLMVPTAKDVLRPSEQKGFTPDDLYRPDLNIRLGVRYLERLRRAFKGHLPVSLAAYNAGIGRMRKWMSRRSETEGLSEQMSSDPMKEIWIDELPWDETSDYVKSVLRNYLIYQMIEAGELALKDPLWLPLES